MGKIALIISTVLVILNTLAGLIFSEYKQLNYVFSDISIILTGGLLYVIANSKTSDGYKVGLYIILCITGIIRFFMAVFSSQAFEDNFLLLIFCAIVGFETVLYLLANFMKKFA